MKEDQPSVNVRSTKYHDNKKFNRRILPKYSKIPLSAMNNATKT